MLKVSYSAIAVANSFYNFLSKRDHFVYSFELLEWWIFYLYGWMLLFEDRKILNHSIGFYKRKIWIAGLEGAREYLNRDNNVDGVFPVFSYFYESDAKQSIVSDYPVIDQNDAMIFYYMEVIVDIYEYVFPEIFKIQEMELDDFCKVYAEDYDNKEGIYYFSDKKIKRYFETLSLF
jgi:hypothetical protein